MCSSDLPVSLVCRKSQTILVRHCYGCGADLGALIWKRPVPVCPGCHAHLALGPVIPASDTLVRYADHLSSRYAALMRIRPLCRHDCELAYFATVWRASQLLRTHECFSEFRERFSKDIGLGEYAVDQDVRSLALQHAFCLAMAHVICDREPTLAEHYWLVAGSRSELRRVDDAILFWLTQFAGKQIGRKLYAMQAHHQAVISFASCSGRNVAPSAA